MIAIYFLGLLALAGAAPHYHMHRGPPPPPPPSPFYHHHGELNKEYFDDDIFDTRRFWQELETEMQKFDQMLTEFYKHFPTTSASEQIEGNEYKIQVTLPGFDQSDVIVKAKEGVLMIQAVHKSNDGNEKTYIDLRTLPPTVNPEGRWGYEHDVLTIVFPLNKTISTESTVVVTEAVTEGLTEHSREEMDPSATTNKEQDADVGLKRGKEEEDSEILTNVIPKHSSVEATTYAVDLKNEVEFVPVKY